MSNLDKAIEVAQRVEHEVLTAASYVSPPSPHEYVEALADAGLLMPDLPEPTRLNHRNEPLWETEGKTKVRTPGRLPVSLNGPFGEGWDMYPQEARDIAYALLTAADHAEKEAHDE